MYSVLNKLSRYLIWNILAGFIASEALEFEVWDWGNDHSWPGVKFTTFW